MAFPWIAEETFELGTKGTFGTPADTDGVIDFPHFSELARFPWSNAAPYTGAYCMRIALAGGTNDATLPMAEVDIADTETAHLAFNLYLAPDFNFTANDNLALLELQGVASAVTVSVGLDCTEASDLITISAGSAASDATPSTDSTTGLKRNTWYTVEVSVTIQTGGTGTVDVFWYADGEKPKTVADIALSSLTQIAVTDAVFGVQDHLATTTGTILLDNFICDDARVFDRPRFSDEVVLTQSGHAFVGHGTVDNVSLLSGGTADNVLSIYDTDEADTNSAFQVGTELKNTAGSELVDPAGTPFSVTRGAFVSLSGTNPRAILKVCRARRSVGTLRDLGMRRG